MANTALRVTELDFDTIKDNLKTYLQGQAEFTDYDFEGSGMSVLLDILAYNTHYMGYYLNMLSNEMFLDTSQIRSSTVSHAKLINYVPESKHGATAKINITVTPSLTEDDGRNIVTLDKYTRLLGEDIDGVNYNFVTVYSNTVSRSGDSFNFSNVNIRQGEVVTRQYLMDISSNPSRKFTIPSANVDLDTVEVVVRESSSNSYSTQYIQSEDITEVTSNSTVYFIEEDLDGNYTFYFGDDVIGKQPANGNIITLTYLESDGRFANNISNFTFIEPIDSTFEDNVSVTAVSASSSGTEKESIEQIKFRAPYYYTAQNRAVTKLDFETLLLKDYNFIKSISVWGGEENDPVVYGKIYISINPKENYTLTEAEKESIKNSLIRNRNVVTVTPEIVDPVFVYVLINGSVTYNQSLTTKTSNQLLELVKASIEDYSDNNLDTFNTTLRKSKLQSNIENSDSSITGSDIDLYLQSRVTITPNETNTYTLNYNVPIQKTSGLVENKLYSYPPIKVNDLESVEREVFFEEVPQSETGISSIDVVSPGRNYTTTPTVTITGDGSGATAVANIINGKIDSIEVTNKGSNYTRATVSITGGGGSEASAIARIESRFGNLRTYYFRDNGEKVIVNENAGDVDYDRGTVTIRSLLSSGVIENNFYNTNVLTINVVPADDIFRPVRNRIMTLDINDTNAIQISMVAE